MTPQQLLESLREVREGFHDVATGFSDVKAEQERINRRFKEYDDGLRSAQPAQSGRPDWRPFIRFLKALKSKDTARIAELGGFPVKDKSDGDVNVKWDFDETTQKAGLGTPITGDDTGGVGSYVLPTRLYYETVARVMAEQSEIVPLVTKINMPGRLVRCPVEDTVGDFTQVSTEISDKTESAPDFTYVDLDVETFAYWFSITDELQDDTFIELQALFMAQAMEKYTDLVETQLLTANAAPFTGILRNASVNVVSGSGASFEDTTWDDLSNMVKELSKKQRRGACFMMNPEIWDILTEQKDAVGKYYVLPFESPPRRAWSHPVLLSDNMPGIGDSAADTPYIALGNPAYLYWGLRVPLEMRYYPETMYSVKNDQNFYRFRTRFATVAAVPGAFSVLETRS